MVDALSGDSIYSEDFYNYLKRSGHAKYFEQYQDALQNGNNQQKMQKITSSAKLKNIWKSFEMQIDSTQCYKLHAHQTNIASLKLELVRVYGLGRRCCPQIRLGIGEVLHCTNIGPAYKDVVEYECCYDFDVWNIREEFLYFQLIDFDIHGRA